MKHGIIKRILIQCNKDHFNKQGKNESVENFFQRVADAHEMTRQEFTAIGFPQMTPDIDDLYMQLVMHRIRVDLMEAFIAKCKRKGIPYNQMSIEDTLKIFIEVEGLQDICDPAMDAGSQNHCS